MKARNTSRSADESARSSQFPAQAPDQNIVGDTNKKSAQSRRAPSRQRLIKRILDKLGEANSFQESATGSLPKILQLEGKNYLLLGDKRTELLKKAIGADDLDFLNGIIRQLSDASLRDGVIDEKQLNFMLSIIKGTKPTYQIETLLVTEMAAVHGAMMSFARHLTTAVSIEEVDSFGNVFSKLARTFATQMEVLHRCRSSGEQKVTVQSVSVGEGGQAIVGNVTQNAADNSKAKATTTPAAITDAHAVPMPIIERTEQPVTVPAKRRRRL